MYNLTIVSMFKNESLILDEWISYYCRQGVDHFYLIDNGSTDNYELALKPYMDKITLIKDPFRVTSGKTNKLKSYDSKTNEYVFNESNCHTQILLANNYFLETIKNTSIWTMYIDCDEYIYIPKSKTIRDYLINHVDISEKYDNICDIFVPWKIFGSNDLEEQPKSIIQGFDKRMDTQSFQSRVLHQGNIRGHGKSITRTKNLTLLNIHTCQFSVDHITLMPNDTVLPNNETMLQEFMNTFDYTQHFIHCNHYMVMSKEYYFNHKIHRADGCGYLIRKNVIYSNLFNSNMNKGNAIHRNLHYWNVNNRNDETDTMLREYENGFKI